MHRELEKWKVHLDMGRIDQPSLETVFYIQTQMQVDRNKQTSLYSKLTDVFIGSRVLISTMFPKLPVYWHNNA